MFKLYYIQGSMSAILDIIFKEIQIILTLNTIIKCQHISNDMQPFFRYSLPNLKKHY